MFATDTAVRARTKKPVDDDVRGRLRGAHWKRDGEIARAVVATLGENAMLPEGKVWVGVSNGWVTLKGHVDWESQRAAAAVLTCHLTGVRGVINSITVAPYTSASDVT